MREVIAAHDLRPRKNFGQNFLLDLNLTRRIAREAGPLDDLHVIEVGPGPGGLTRALLLEGARKVTAIEADARCLPALAPLIQAAGERLTVLRRDALTVDFAGLLDRDGPAAIIANLPYNVGTALLVGWLSGDGWPPGWQSLTLMFQREVADRIVARPGSKTFGRLSILAQWRATARVLFNLPARAFTPPPKVASAIVRLEPRPAPADVRFADLESVSAAAFSQRRKMLRQSLRALGCDTEALCACAGIEPSRRAETLEIAEFLALARAYRALKPETKSSTQG